MVRAAIYLRSSLDETGERLAVQRHEEACRAILAARGWDLTEIYEDNSITASDARKARPAYDRMERDFAAGAFDALVVWDLDRLARRPRQLEDWIDAAETRGLVIVTANGDADLGTDAGRLFARIKLAVAKAEVERKSARQRLAAQQRAHRGRPPLGVRLTGYTVAGELVPEEAEMVASMFRWFATGESLRGIVGRLETAGHTTRHGKAWNPSSVRTILTNGRYAGRAVYDGQHLPGVQAGWQPIVDEALFDAVQARLADPRRRTHQGTDRKHLGSSIYLCGICDTPMPSHSRGYRCPAGGHVLRSWGPVDRYVLAVLRGRLARPDVVEYLTPRDDVAGARLTAEIGRLRKRLVTIESDYDNELIDGRRYQESSAKVRAELAAAEAERTRAIGNPAVAEIVGAPDPVAAFNAATLMVQREVLAAFVTVRLHRAPRGSRTFDPASVTIDWVDQE